MNSRHCSHFPIASTDPCMDMSQKNQILTKFKVKLMVFLLHSVPAAPQPHGLTERTALGQWGIQPHYPIWKKKKLGQHQCQSSSGVTPILLPEDWLLSELRQWQAWGPGQQETQERQRLGVWKELTCTVHRVHWRDLLIGPRLVSGLHLLYPLLNYQLCLQWLEFPARNEGK